MKRSVTTEINRERCTGCGLCVAVCPSETLSLIKEKATVTGDHSLQCGHCAAICPEDAITVGGVDRNALQLATVNYHDEWLGYGDFDMPSLVRLMRSRRSCRMFSAQSVERDVLEDLVKIGTTAPSGTNSQRWTFTIMPERATVITFGAAVGRFFRYLNTMAEMSVLRGLSKLIMKDALGVYYRDHYEAVKKALEEWKKTGRDRLFHGAPAVILVGMKPGASCPCEDALMASQNILLAAHAMGLATCMVGFVVTAMKYDPRIKKLLDIPREERVYAAIAVGHPEHSFVKMAGRKKVVCRYYEG